LLTILKLIVHIIILFCRICGNLFRRKADLKSHMVCHQLERPHRCPQCGADFQRPTSLTNHMKLHTYIPGRALHISSTSVPPPLSNYFLPTNTQSNQPISNKVSGEPVSSYNGWDGNVLPQNQNLETPVTSSNCELTYQSLEPEQYSRTTRISENISEFHYGTYYRPLIYIFYFSVISPLPALRLIFGTFLILTYAKCTVPEINLRDDVATCGEKQLQFMKLFIKST